MTALPQTRSISTLCDPILPSFHKQCVSSSMSCNLWPDTLYSLSSWVELFARTSTRSSRMMTRLWMMLCGLLGFSLYRKKLEKRASLSRVRLLEEVVTYQLGRGKSSLLLGRWCAAASCLSWTKVVFISRLCICYFDWVWKFSVATSAIGSCYHPSGKKRPSLTESLQIIRRMPSSNVLWEANSERMSL